MKTYELRAEARYREYQGILSRNKAGGGESALEEALK